MRERYPLATEGGIERRGLRDEVHDRLLDMLMEAQLRPGMRLGIDALARQLGVSPTPVREAMVLLERTGLVEREPLKGYRVAEPLSESAMVELMEARELLEVRATTLAIPNAARFLPQLSEAHVRHTQIIESITMAGTVATPAEYRRCFDADWGFHHVIVQNSGNRFIDQMLDGLTAHVHRLRQEALNDSYDLKEALEEHQAVLDGFSSDAPERAVSAMRAHMEGVRRRVAGHEPG